MEWQIKAALDIAGRDFKAERFAQAAAIYSWLAGRVTSLRDRLEQIDNRGRFLKAIRNPQHENAWFRVLTASTKVDARG